MGCLFSWELEVVGVICDVIWECCFGMFINMFMGVVGFDIRVFVVCLECVKLEMVVFNVGSLNYLWVWFNGIWVWLFMLFDNVVDKI